MYKEFDKVLVYLPNQNFAHVTYTTPKHKVISVIKNLLKVGMAPIAIRSLHASNLGMKIRN